MYLMLRDMFRDESGSPFGCEHEPREELLYFIVSFFLYSGDIWGLRVCGDHEQVYDDV